MKKIVLTSLVVVMATFNASASVAPYVSLHGGIDNYKMALSSTKGISLDPLHLMIESDSAYDLSGAVGVKYDMVPGLGIRGEFEYNYINADFKEAVSGSSNVLLMNGYVDFKSSIGLNSYVGAGIGYQWNDFKGKSSLTGLSLDAKKLAYQFGAGVSYDITKNIGVDFGYRCLMSALDKTMDMEFDATVHQFRFGATYTF